MPTIKQEHSLQQSNLRTGSEAMTRCSLQRIYLNVKVNSKSITTSLPVNKNMKSAMIKE